MPFFKEISLFLDKAAKVFAKVPDKERVYRQGGWFKKKKI